jgi:[acyl-carrier-protein] S-malonyltransferase
MERAVPAGEGGMAAVLGLDAEAVAALCVEAADGEIVVPANFNGGGQIVVAGHAGAVGRLVALAGTRGGRAQRLPVSGPFHSPLMAPAAESLGVFVRSLAFRAPVVAVVTSVEARAVRGEDELPELLVRQLTSPVRWEETMQRLAALGATLALETGPGRVLCGLAKRTAPSLAAIPAGDVAGIARAREALAA